MHRYICFLLLGSASVIVSHAGEPHKECGTQTFIYEDLRCTPKNKSPDSCPAEYDCSHIFNRPPGKCLFRRQLYNPGDIPDDHYPIARCDHASCRCAEGGQFECLAPSDTCAEFWVPNYIKPGCYLTYELNRCCNNEQKCPPFGDIAKCEVTGVIYREGERFNPPNEQCTRCICTKEFDGTFKPPYCRRTNCSEELTKSYEIGQKCAPFYRSRDYCCPNSWICPSEEGTYVPSTSPSASSDSVCVFGERKMHVGEKYLYTLRGERISCECVVPPFLTCFPAFLK